MKDAEPSHTPLDSLGPTDASPSGHSPAETPPIVTTTSPRRRKRKRVRFGLLELLLLTALVAAWLPVILAQRKIPVFESEIETMRLASTQLIVVDDRKLNARTMPSIWSNINSWKYYLPANADHELRLATEHINSVSSPSDYLAAALPAGEHSIHFKCTNDADGYHSVVYVDDEIVLEKHHPKSWIDSQGSSSTGDFSGQSTAYPLDVPLKLKIQRFSAKHPLKKYQSMDVPDEYDSKGNYLWISPTATVPEPSPVFYLSGNKYSHDGVGHRQGTKVFRSQQTGFIGLIGILPSIEATRGDDRQFYPYCPLGITVHPVLNSQQDADAREENGTSLGVPLSLRDSLTPPERHDESYAREPITKASIKEDGKSMRIFAHYKPFKTGAKPIVEIFFDAAHPNRVGFLPHAAPGSAPMKACQFMTRFDARYLWREIELSTDETQEGPSEHGRQPLASLYPNTDFTEPDYPTVADIAPFAWRNIAISKLPISNSLVATMQNTNVQTRQLNLTTNVANATELNYPPGLPDNWRYEGIPNRQTWLLPTAGSENEPEITIELRGGSVFPTAQLPVPGGPVIQNVRITVPMPAQAPVWLEIAADPIAASQ
ncbi:hypothetical protein FHS27_006310 [Rhodopirellula rubra]|uniref:Uncharacterized protein n=1 Tax=Aporhodopirellula rubra TaxID=980271 RepID=A0A7W5E6G8_9BACT|nr:hypothetical protein [Aporhodopirellula rubra]MBB3210463.1 hypothetical protein [Aporhodopirellula rubra]